MSLYQFKLFLLEVVLIFTTAYTGANIIKKLNGGIDMNNKGNKIVRYIIGGGVIGLFFILRAIFKNFL